MTAIPTIETERLILRAPRADEFDAWAAMFSDAETMAFIGGAMDRAQTRRSMAAVVGAWTLRGFSMFSVIEKSTGRWVGRLGPWQPEGWPGTEVGWAISRDAWGKGYAVEGAAAAIDWAFDFMDWDEVIHTIEPENANSARVAQKLGSTILRQAVLLAPLNRPVDCWGQTREQWRVRRR